VHNFAAAVIQTAPDKRVGL